MFGLSTPSTRITERAISTPLNTLAAILRYWGYPFRIYFTFIQQIEQAKRQRLPFNLFRHFVNTVAKPSILIWKIGHAPHRMNFVRIIEWILLELFHKYRRESNAYQGEFNEFCCKFIECMEQNQIYLNFIVNMWKLSNAYTRHQILTHFGNHRPSRCHRVVGS